MRKSMNPEKLDQVVKNNAQKYLNDFEFTNDFTLVIMAIEP